MALATVPAVSAPPQPLCAVDDGRLAELSGMVVDRGGLWALADGGRRVDLHRLDVSDCSVTDTRTAPIDPFDAEDLARGPEGALWVADTGDNRRERETVAVIVLPVRSADARARERPFGEARLHRLAYPDGPHDAEALLVDTAGVPVVVTKEAGRPAGIYRTEGSLAGPSMNTEGSLTGPSMNTEGSLAGPSMNTEGSLAGRGPTPLVRVGEVALPPSDTPGGPIGGLGSRVVTGAATSADGRVVALRSYTDAWLFAVPDGDVVAALAGPPVRVPLPDEPQGEAIAFELDGTLLSGSETRGGEAGEIRAVPGAAGLMADQAGGAAAVAGQETASDDPTPDWLPAAVGAAATVAALALLAVALLLWSARR